LGLPDIQVFARSRAARANGLNLCDSYGTAEELRKKIEPGSEVAKNASQGLKPILKKATDLA
jgi:hypothetical protein